MLFINLLQVIDITEPRYDDIEIIYDGQHYNYTMYFSDSPAALINNLANLYGYLTVEKITWSDSFDGDCIHWKIYLRKDA